MTICDTDYLENKAIAWKAQTLSTSRRLAAMRISVGADANNVTVNYSERVGHVGSDCRCLLHVY